MKRSRLDLVVIQSVGDSRIEQNLERTAGFFDYGAEDILRLGYAFPADHIGDNADLARGNPVFLSEAVIMVGMIIS